MNSKCETLVGEIHSLPWFRNVGMPTGEFDCRWIESWADWPGPEFAGVEQLSLDLQAIKDDIDHELPGTTVTWDECVAVAVEAISKFVQDYDESKDTWHAPTAAVWHAAWVIGLKTVLADAGWPIPAIIDDQLAWFARGHWPSAYTRETRSGKNKEYIVF